MSKSSESSGAASRHTSTRRYWRRTESPRPWWPWGLLPLMGLVVLFLFGALVTAPEIQAEVRDQVADRIKGAGVVASVIRGDGQGVNVQVVAPEEDGVFLHALAKSTACDTWAGPLTCPTTVSVRLNERNTHIDNPARDPQPAPVVMPEPPAASYEPATDAADCNEQFDAILSNATVRFRSGSAMVDRGNEDLLQTLAQTARSCSGDLTIAGYTDSRGSTHTNRELSLARAQAVGDALVQLGIDRDRITAKGFGESDPIADNDTPAGRAKNRRIAITIDDLN